uniref:Uncharacterized protein LOC100176447 n=1 Tax=Phallusia mammillata TaxID=59560 RepID=A0A6F9DFX9_9ASCI|nr:uncharacterized protein LOC100176447 [Phallusia mammillata]
MMTHLFDVDFSVLPPGKEPVSKKLQQKSSETSSAKKRESKKLDIDNKQMEWRLNQLKKAMEKEKEARGSQGYIWQSGKNVALESHARNTLGHSVKTSQKKGTIPAKKPHSPVKPRVKVLKDEPLDIRKRPNHTKELIGTLLKEDPDLTDSPMQDNQMPRVNKETWISVALDPSQDDIMEMQSDQDGNLPLPCLTAIEPMAIGLYFKRWGRKRLLLAVDGRMMRPKQGWGSEVYYPYIGNVSPQKINGTVPSPQSEVKRTPRKPHKPPVETKTGGKLLEGTFDEEESAESFKNAIMEWRQKPEGGSDSPKEMSVHAVQSEPAEIAINFSETSTLSFMERLLLKKHRTSEVPPLPQTSVEDDQNYQKSDAIKLTEEEIEDHERIRQLFTPQPRADSASTMEWCEDVSNQQTCLITEIPTDSAEDPIEQSSSVCYVDEADEQISIPLQTSHSRVNIEEVTFPGIEPTVVEEIRPMTKSTSPSPAVKQSAPKKSTSEPSLPLTPKRPSVSKSAVFTRRIIQKDQVQKSKQRPKSANVLAKPNENVSASADLLHAVSTLPINPDAFYHNGLGEFFSSATPKPEHHESSETQHLPENLLTCNQGSNFWEPLTSLTLDEPSERLDSKMQSLQEVPIAEDTIQNDVEMEKADANTLDALEWELASQTGNITSDGRISRLIDEWSSEEEDLGIINDPGLGSGLSSPEVDHRSLGSATMQSATWKDEENLLHDFEQMEQFMMADLKQDTDSEEDIVD